MQLVFESTYHLPDKIEFLYNIHIITIIIILILSIIFKNKIYRYKGLIVLFLICSFFYYQGLNSTIELSKEIHKSFLDKSYKVLVGEIKNLKPMHPSGHGLETFEVNGISFSTSYGNTSEDNTFFFNLTKAYGSPIRRNGQKVKIFYLPTKVNKLCIPFIPECLKVKDKRGIIKLWLVE